MVKNTIKLAQSTFQEKTFQIRNVQISVKLWHENSEQKIIALHGWLDNAGSFDVLAPLLPGCIAAIDLAGQGFSEDRPQSATYHLWDDILDVLLIAEALGWQKFTLLGHSRGAMLATMLAASFPERVNKLWLIDGIMPFPVEIENAPNQLRNFIDDYMKPEKPVKFYPDKSAAIQLRAKAGGIPYSLAEILALRNLHKNESGWFWHTDERLKAASALKLSVAHNKAFLQAVKCPTMIFLADKGIGNYPQVLDLINAYPHFDWHKLSGHHHMHMENQANEIARICLGD